MTHISTQMGQRDKDLARVGHRVSETLIAQNRSHISQRPSIREVRQGQGFGVRQPCASQYVL